MNKYYIGLQLNNETKSVEIIGIGRNKEEALKDKKCEINEAFSINNPIRFHVELETWLIENTDMVALEAKDMIKDLIWHISEELK